MATSDSIVSKKGINPIEWELYFLIERFLATGPCKSAANVLRRELIEQGLLPRRIDWNGDEHERSYESLLQINKHIGGDHLLKICRRLGPLLDEKIRPYVQGVGSLLGAGSHSLLRTEEDVKKTEWQAKNHLVLQHGQPKLPPKNLVVPNWLFVQRGGEMSGQTHFNHVVPVCMYSRMRLLSRKVGHLSAIYCVLFDRTGEFMFTGADDSLVKIWNVRDSRLKATMRGHGAEITDMAINCENTLLASGSCDRTIRVWCLKSRSPVAVLQGHTGMITSLQFSPMVQGTKRFLASTGGDACVCFWEWNVTTHQFNSRPVKYVEKSRAGAQVLCSSFSPGGMFFAAGSTDNVIRMYHFHAGLTEKIGELEKHSDRVDSICYANNDNRFLSGSKDGTARIWKYERSEWRNIVLDMNIKLPKKVKDDKDKKKRQCGCGDEEQITPPKLRVTMVSWNIDDTCVVTAVSDRLIKVWCSFTGTLIHELSGHEDEVFVLEPSMIDKRILLSAGHDGKVIIWDVERGVELKHFFNMIEGQGHGAVFDCKLSPAGTTVIATDSYGHMMIYGHGSSAPYEKLPNALFFHTDYRPLMRDSNNYVLDEQTQQVPHLMPPPFLVDIDGNPYPPDIQRLVPGREKCRGDQLIPEFTVNEEGEQEVMGDRVLEQPEETNSPEMPEPEQEPNTSNGRDSPSGTEPQAASIGGEVHPTIRPSIDQMIEQLAREQDQRLAAEGRAPLSSPGPPQMGSPNPRAGPSRSNSVAGPTSSTHVVGMRRTGETEGVRQSLGNILQVSTSKDLAAISRRIVVRDMDRAVLKQNEQWRRAMADCEIQHYYTERRKKPLVVTRDSSEEPMEAGIQTRKKKKSKHGYTTRANIDEETATNRLTTRALYDTDEELMENGLGSDVYAEEEDVMYNGDSSDYSDWCLDTSSNLQPPKRKSTRIKKRKRYSSSEEEEEESDEDTADTQNSGSQAASHDNSEPVSREGSQTRGRTAAKTKQPVIKKKRGKKKKQTSQEAAALPGKTAEEIQALLTRFRPPDWLTDVIPRKSPYFPQMGDEVMYFRQGHELYVKAVDARKVYPIEPNKNQAWHKYPSLREQELVRIVGIRYELIKCGVRLCCLKLNYIDPVSLKNTGGSFSIKYHDMPDVVDFLVLKQNYDIAMDRKWKPGDRFQSMIDDSWWMGIIEAQIPFQEHYPDSWFQCFKVRWDNAEREHLSPWDLEPTDESRKGILKPDSLHVKIKTFIESCKSLFGHTSNPSSIVSDIYSNVKDTDNFALFHLAPEVKVTHGVNERRCVSNERKRDVYKLASSVKINADSGSTERSEGKRSTLRSRMKSQANDIETSRLTRSRSKGSPLAHSHETQVGKNKPKSKNSKSIHFLNEEEENAKARWRDSKEFFTKKCPPSVIGGGVLVTPEELKSLMYKPRKSEWPGVNVDQECDRIVRGWEQVMGHSLAEPFLTPVDLNAFHSYAMTIEYPMDLNTIKRRLENRFYRRVTALQFDLRYIESNAKKFNEPRSQIVKGAQILCDALLKFIGDVNSEDPCQVINSLVHGRKIEWKTEDSGDETEDYDTPGTPDKTKQGGSGAGNSAAGKHRHLSVARLNPDGWKAECRNLFDTIVQWEDSEPFRNPVNIEQYPDYYNVIEEPMDLNIVREKLDTGEYTSPTQMARDMSLIFNNSKHYNTNKRSRIYTMTLRVSAMFDSRMKNILSTWKQAVKSRNKRYPMHRKSQHEGRVNGASRAARGTRAGTSGLANGNAYGSDTESEVDVTRHTTNKLKRSKSGRLLRVRRPVKGMPGYVSDREEFPDPKPDYTDDDFEVEPKPSPKKKGAKRHVDMNNSATVAMEDEYASGRYSTRAQTGTIKMRKYTNEGFFTDEDDNESVISVNRKTSAKSSRSQPDKRSKKSGPVTQESSGSETEIESPHTSVRVAAVKDELVEDDEQTEESEHTSEETEVDSEPVKPVSRGRGRKPRVGRRPGRKKTKQNGRVQKPGRRAKVKVEVASEHSDSGDSSSSSSSSVKSEEGWETDSEPVVVERPRRRFQGKSQSEQLPSTSDSDSGPPRKRSRTNQNNNYAASSTSSRGKRIRRTCNQRVKYNEDSGNSESDNGSSVVTVSLHGRVRRPTARARAMLY